MFVPGGQTFFTHSINNFYLQRVQMSLYKGGNKHYFMIMIIIENVSEANILSSEARKPPAGARISGPVGP